jgi:cobalt/nickel transport system ATP-binding protein
LSVPLFRTEGLFFRYEGGHGNALADVNITIEEGTRTVIMGANGAGKSTFFYHLNGVLRPSKGSVFFRGKKVPHRGKALRMLRSEVAVVLQDPNNQLFAPKVSDDIAFGPKNLGLDAQTVEDRVEEALHITGIEFLKNRSVMQLSFGQKKRVVLAGALAMHPKVLIMDEPTAGLDPQMSREIIELADELHHLGTTVIFSTHDVDLSYSWADEIHVLRGGRNVYSGDSEGFYDDTSEVYLSGLVEPAMYDMNVSISELAGCPAEPFPKTLPQLVAKTVPLEEPGTVHILPVDGLVDSDMFSSLVSGLGVSATGVYGTKARKSAGESRLPIDYFFGADEGCVLEAMHGNDTLICCDKGLTDLLISKICGTSEFGTVIPYSLH